MRVADVYTGAFMTAAQFVGKGPQTFTIKSVRLWEDDDGRGKLVLGFHDTQQELAVNKSNAGRIAEMFGEETERWVGQCVTLAAEKVEFQGKRVDGIRVQVEAPKSRGTGGRGATEGGPGRTASDMALESGILSVTEKAFESGAKYWLIEPAQGPQMFTRDAQVAKGCQNATKTPGVVLRLVYREKANSKGVAVRELVELQDPIPPADDVPDFGN